MYAMPAQTQNSYAVIRRRNSLDPASGGARRQSEGLQELPVDVALALHRVAREEIVEQRRVLRLWPTRAGACRLKTRSDGLQCRRALAERAHQALRRIHQALELGAFVDEPAHQLAEPFVAGFDLAQRLENLRL